MLSGGCPRIHSGAGAGSWFCVELYILARRFTWSVRAFPSCFLSVGSASTRLRLSVYVCSFSPLCLLMASAIVFAIVSVPYELLMSIS